jgi:hypothetical protein
MKQKIQTQTHTATVIFDKGMQKMSWRKDCLFNNETILENIGIGNNFLDGTLLAQ